MTALILEPEEGIVVDADGYMAVSRPAWLRIANFVEACGRKWFRIRYASSFFDRPVRPLLRFRTSTGRELTCILNGPALGTAEWIGCVPEDTVDVSISPTDRIGRFGFRIEEARPISKAALASKDIVASASLSHSVIVNTLSGTQRYKIRPHKIANAATPLSRYAQWRKRFQRSPELGGLDKPRSDWSTGPLIGLLLPVDRTTSARALEKTIRSLRDQLYQRWSVRLCGAGEASGRVIRTYRTLAAQDRRLQPVEAGSTADHDWYAVVSPGDQLDAIALAAMAEEIAQDPEARVIYSDEDAITGYGRLHSPLLKPDWSPIFQARTGYIGRLTLVRADALAAVGHADPQSLALDEQRTLQDVLASLPPSQVSHLRRILYRRSGAGAKPAPCAAATIPAAPAEWPEVSVVIATRDRADLLGTCLEGLRRMTDYPALRVVIVDNGSTEPDALRILDAASADPRFSVVRRPGPFNFSALSNDGAALAQSPCLVFLNNDIEMCDPQWLKALVAQAMRPQIAFAGARLLYPSGRIQHAGVTLGVGTVCGHLYSKTAGDDRGVFDQLVADREVSAVTAACCAIERAKFESLGGFDETHLPVEFSDIDLCLRAIERGWSNVYVAGSRLIHRESESRGVAPAKVYEAERAWFLQRWRHVVRDDPYFHPGLSMFGLYPSLA